MTSTASDSIVSRIFEIEDVLNKDISEGVLMFSNISGGANGAILFYLHLYKLTSDDQYLNKTYELIEKSINKYQFNERFYSFCGGLAGIHWTMSYLIKNEIVEESVYDALSDTEVFLYNKMIKELDSGFYDFLHSSLGIFFALMNANKLKHIDKELLIEKVVQKLEEISIVSPEGIKWNDVNFMEGKVNKDRYNLGLSHGIPSIVSILAKSIAECKSTELKERIKRLAEGGGDFMISIMSKDETTLSLYPFGFDEGKPINYSSRLAWCYGDLGVALSFWHLYTATQNIKWKKTALKIVEHSSRRFNLQANDVKDAGFCHGTCGIAHIFKKFFYLTGDTVFKDAADYWIKKTLAFGQWRDGLAGYKYYNGTHGYIKNYGLLEGLIGTGLVLISAQSEQEFDWDKVWLVS